MKKSLRILALAMVTVMLCLALASCGAPNADPDKAKDALEDNDYAAYKFDTDGLLGGLVSGALDMFGDIEGLDCVVTGVKLDENEKEELEGDAITIFYFEDAEAAKNAMDEVEKLADEEKEENKDISIGKSGKMIWFGTKDAVKAAK